MTYQAFNMQRLQVRTESSSPAFRFVGRENLPALEQTWRTLGRQQGGPIEQFDWAAACATSTSAPQIEIVGTGCGDKLDAIVPLAIKRIGGIERRIMLGADEYFEPMNFLAANTQSRNGLIDALAHDPRPLLLPRLPIEDGAVDALRNGFKGHAIVVVRPAQSFPYIPLDDTWKAPETHLNAGRQSDFRRMRRRLENQGQAVTDILTPTPAQLAPLLDEAFDVEAKSWKGTTGTALLFDIQRQEHFRSYLLAMSQAGKCRIGFLRMRGKAIAMEIAVEENDALWVLKVGYDMSFAHCSPGQLLLRDMIAHAAETGLKSFEFLGVCEPWIDIWTSHKRECRAVRIYPFSPQGALAILADSSRQISRLARSRAKDVRPVIRRCAMPMLRLAAKPYIAGSTLADAMRVAQALRRDGINSTIGFWNMNTHTPAEIADQALAGFAQLAKLQPDDYLSVKLAALKFNKELIDRLATAATEARRRMHLDAHGIEFVNRKMAVCEALQHRYPDLDLGFTLPGRWERSIDDADWVCQQGLFVRIVKGQHPDPAKPAIDLAQGFMNVVKRLAGRARRVAVATHDPQLAMLALRWLQAAGTPCELELLYGWPLRPSIRVARELDVPVRVYIPYGEGFVPYALSQMAKNPRIAWWVLRDSVTALCKRD